MDQVMGGIGLLQKNNSFASTVYGGGGSPRAQMNTLIKKLCVMKGSRFLLLVVIILIFGIYHVVILFRPLRHLRTSNSSSFEMPLGATNFSRRLSPGAYALCIGEETLEGQQPMVIFTVSGELITNVETNPFIMQYNPFLKIPFVFYHFDVSEGQEEVRVALNISALEETTNTFYVRCFPVK